jgi:hypothetical protein
MLCKKREKKKEKGEGKAGKGKDYCVYLSPEYVRYILPLAWAIAIYLATAAPLLPPQPPPQPPLLPYVSICT